MHFNIYLDDETGRQLSEAARQAGESRNALIRRAVGEWLARRGTARWPQTVLAFTGEPEMPPFEAGRDDLARAKADPLA